MPHISADVKHSILLEYIPHSTTHSFAALARRHDVAGGGEVVRRWHQRWNRTPESLKRHEGSGATPILTPLEVSRHIRAPILAANRAQRAIQYPDVWKQVQTKTGKKIALRTLQQYGKEKCQAKERTTHKRTRAECECRHTSCVACACVLPVYAADSYPQCLLLPVRRSLSCVANSSANASDTSSSSMRLHSDSMLLHCARLSSRTNNHTSSRQRLPLTLLAST